MMQWGEQQSVEQGYDTPLLNKFGIILGTFLCLLQSTRPKSDTMGLKYNAIKQKWDI